MANFTQNNIIFLFFIFYFFPLKNFGLEFSNFNFSNSLAYNSNLSLDQPSELLNLKKPDDSVYLLNSVIETSFLKNDSANFSVSYFFDSEFPFQNRDFSYISQSFLLNFRQNFSRFSLNGGVTPQLMLFNFDPYFYNLNIFGELYLSEGESFLTNFSNGVNLYGSLTTETEMLKGPVFNSEINQFWYFDLDSLSFLGAGLSFDRTFFPAVESEYYTFNYGYMGAGGKLFLEWNFLERWGFEGNIKHLYKIYEDKDFWQDVDTFELKEKKRRDLLANYNFSLSFKLFHGFELTSFFNFTQNFSNFYGNDAAYLNRTYIQFLLGMGMSYNFGNKD